FGTIHALPAGTVWFDRPIAAALAGSDELVTEIDLADTESLRAGFAQKSLLPAGQNLRDLMPAEDRAPYEKAMAVLGLPPAAFDRYKPGYAGLMLSMLPVLQQGYSPEDGVEPVLAAHRGAQTRTGALETAAFQLNLFDSMPMAEQLSYLRSTVEASPEMADMLGKMVVEWLDGDADELANLINEQDDDPALLERLLYSRNRTWAGWIARRLDRPGTVFVAVGAGHLAGPGSVQDVLARRGIASSRVQ
ncbi:MAG: TraB/GumN family protein, partial [Novosphingobium sp.]|nr:TraB/GumN family protein [Novosphingobium sp.]